MTRTITLTVAEAEHLATLPAGGTLWLVRDGDMWISGGKFTDGPPADFVDATAPCPTCSGWTRFAGDGKICPTCGGDRRIELVGPCPTCAGTGWRVGHDRVCDDCDGEGTITAHRYADSQPLPIIDGSSPYHVWPDGSFLCVYPPRPKRILSGCILWATTSHLSWHNDGQVNLAHYGDPVSLVGKWALQVRVMS